MTMDDPSHSDAGRRHAGKRPATASRHVAGSSGTGRSDAGCSDAGHPDTSHPDACRSDTSRSDAGRSDAGRPDTGHPDTGRSDAGRSDTGRPDACRSDTSRSDAGRSDAGRPDTGRSDAGRSDTGHSDADRPDTGRSDIGRDAVLRTMDHCTKCGICRAYCPVASATERFPGPKYAGPQAQRFRTIDAGGERSSALCSGCGVCTSVCPNGVAVSDIITIARAEAVGSDANLPLRQRLLNRPDAIGRVLGAAPALANGLLGNSLLRAAVHHVLGIHREAALPRASGRAFRRWLSAHRQPDDPAVAYFTGCAVTHYDAGVGMAAVRVLNRLGHAVEVPTDTCCALPMLSSGEWGAARHRADTVVRSLAPGARAGKAILSTSTSCSLTLRDKYAAYLDLCDDDARSVAGAVTDICEFLRDHHFERLSSLLGPLPRRVFYHGPCQLRGHSMGVPALELLRLVPSLVVEVSESECCGVAGTYGYDRERHDIAAAVGRGLVERIAESAPDAVVCDSETCRWHIAASTGVPCVHPIEIVDASFRVGELQARTSERSV